MNIFFILDDYLPVSKKVTPKMIHELACNFTNSGHKVNILTPDSNIQSDFDILFLDQVKVFRFKSNKLKNVPKVSRAISETLLSYFAWKRLKKILKQEECDLIIYVSPSIFFGPLVFKLKKLWNAKSYLILRDLFPQWAIDSGLLRKKSLFTYYFKLFERINYNSADIIGLMSLKNLEWFKDHYRTNKKLEVLYNWSITHLSSNQNKSTYRKDLGLNNKVVFFYGGTFGYAQDMMNLIRLADNMKKDKLAHFVLVGGGDEFELIQKSIIKYDLKNTTLLKSVNQKEYSKMLKEFDVGLFTLHKNHQTHNFPGKILSYMLNEKPILGSVNHGNDLKEIIENFQAGYICENGEDEFLASGARELLNASLRKRVGENAKKLLVNKFSIEKASSQILENFYTT